MELSIYSDYFSAMINSCSPRDKMIKEMQEKLRTRYDSNVSKIIKDLDIVALIQQVFVSIDNAIISYSIDISTLNLMGLFPHLVDQYVSIIAFGVNTRQKVVNRPDTIKVEIKMNDFMDLNIELIRFGNMFRIININIV
jgi:hypothetical protein